MLTYDDYEILVKAVDAWMKEGGKSEMLGTMMGLIMSRSKEEAERLIKQTPEEERSRERNKAHTQRVGTILKAKLLQMQDELMPQDSTNVIA